MGPITPRGYPVPNISKPNLKFYQTKNLYLPKIPIYFKVREEADLYVLGQAFKGTTIKKFAFAIFEKINYILLKPNTVTYRITKVWIGPNFRVATH